jgi:hypothetical protein
MEEIAGSQGRSCGARGSRLIAHFAEMAAQFTLKWPTGSKTQIFAFPVSEQSRI